MPEYLAPGVYVEEVDTGPRPIEGVSTSTAGFVGETERGPTRPRLVTSWQDYQRWYGTYIDQMPLNANNCYLPYAVRGFFENGGQRVFVARVTPKADASKVAAITYPGAALAAVPLPTGTAATTVVSAIGPGLWGNRIYITVRPATAAILAQAQKDAAKAGDPAKTATPDALGWFSIKVLYYRLGISSLADFVDPTDPNELANPKRVTPDAYELFDNLSADPSRSNYARSVVNNSSCLIKVLACNGLPTFDALHKFQALTGAPPDYVPAAVTDYDDADTAEPEARTGLAALKGIREISLMTVPDEIASNMGDVAAKLLDICDTLRDRFAILSEQAGSGIVGDIRPPRDSSYGAYYYPWIRVTAPHTPEGTRLISANGHLAGIYARTDVERGVHKAPANEVVRGILTRDLAGGLKPLGQTLNKAEQDILNPIGVNVIRDFRTDGRDIRVWGARTMSSDSQWKYINVRRLFIFIEQSIDRGTQWAVFEPNSEITWISLRAAITNFLGTVWRNGALMGQTQEEAFFVRCDRTTMTQDDFDNGRLICLIGIAPVKPAEFVIFRISQKTLDSES